MKYISVDVEADGPVPYYYSMISLGAVVVEPKLNHTFYAELRPISANYNEDALYATGFSRRQTLDFPDAVTGIFAFKEWLDNLNDSRLVFVSDNAGFDWMFVSYYCAKYLGKNPFGYSPMSLTWLYKGLVKDTRQSFKHLRRTKHSHNALDDAMGNAESLLEMNRIYELEMI